MELKANELRLGNIFDADMALNAEKILSVTSGRITAIFEYGVSFKDKTVFPLELIKPIVITEDILLQFGFELCNEAKITKRYNHDINPFIEMISQNDWMSSKVIVAQRSELLATIHYVHQLQNLYFALTGQELPVTETV